MKLFGIKEKVMSAVGVGSFSLLPATSALAESPTANTSLTSAAQTAVDQTIANINGVLPIALGILGTVMAIMIGIRVFRKITKSSAAG